MRLTIGVFILASFCSFNLFGQWTTLNSGVTTSLNAIDFVNQDTGMVGGDGLTNPTLLRTFNRGLTWTPITINTLQSIGSITYASGSNVYLSTAGEEIFKSTDNGTTFSKLNNISGAKVYFINSTTGFVTKWVSNTIWKTTDGGNNWSYVTIPGVSGSGNYNKLSFVNNLVGYGVHQIGGGYSSVIKTTDGGSTWSVTAQPTTLGLYDISFISTDTGYIGGDNGLLMKTTNGGINWSIISAPSNPILSLKCINRKAAYLSSGGNIYKSDSSITNWTIMSGSSNGIYFTFPTDSIGYACGGSGTILTMHLAATAIKEQIKDNLIVLFPNPATNNLTVRSSFFQTNSIVTVSIMNMRGEIMQKKEETKWSNDKYFNIKFLPAGIYIFQVENEFGIWKGRFVKE